MQATDLTIQILQGIRDEIRETRVELSGRIDSTRHELSERIDETNQRLHEMRTELSRRIVESEVRAATAMADVAGTVRDMTDVLRAQHDLRPRLERCERDIAELKRRSGALM